MKWIAAALVTIATLAGDLYAHMPASGIAPDEATGWSVSSSITLLTFGFAFIDRKRQ